MLSLLRHLFRRECPTCHKLIERDRLERHVRRHQNGFAQYKKVVFQHPHSLDGPPCSITVTFRKVNGAWTALDSRELREAVRDVPHLKERILDHLNALNAADKPTFTRREIRPLQNVDLSRATMVAAADDPYALPFYADAEHS